MLSPHNSISKKFLLHFDYVYRISLVRGKMQSRSQCVSAWAIAEPCRALPAWPLEGPALSGRGKDLPRSSWRKPGSPLLVSKVQSPCRSGFPGHPPQVCRGLGRREKRKPESRGVSRDLQDAGKGLGSPHVSTGFHGHRTGPVKCPINSILNIHFNECVCLCVYHTLPCKFYLSCTSKFEYFIGKRENE